MRTLTDYFIRDIYDLLCKRIRSLLCSSLSIDTDDRLGIRTTEVYPLLACLERNLHTVDSVDILGSIDILDLIENLIDKSLIREAVSGRQMLLDNGVQQSRSTRLEPRTAVGVTRDGKRLFILVADGRRKEYSNGLSYADMAQIFKQLGAYDAINLDGGGSSSFSIEVATGDFEPINRPSDRSGERPVPNGLAVVELR